MSVINNVSFHGNTAEQFSATNPTKQQYAATNFKGYQADTYESSQKKKRTGLVIAGVIAAAAALFVGLGYSNKWVSNMKDGKFKNFAEPITSKCHEWCGLAKQKGIEGWETVKGWFHKKQS